jgi:hypothetical protein
MAKRSLELKRISKRHCAQLKKKGIRPTKYPLRGKPLIYRDPFIGVAMGAWEAASDEALENFEKGLKTL